MWSELFARRVVMRLQAERDRLSLFNAQPRSSLPIFGGGGAKENIYRMSISDRRSSIYADQPATGVRTNTRMSQPLGTITLGVLCLQIAAQTAITFERNTNRGGDKDTLYVEWIDMHVVDNARNHHTNAFDLCTLSARAQSPEQHKLIVRRGQAFTFEMQFNRPLQKTYDRLDLIWAFTGVSVLDNKFI
jgi:hypothetical protein